MPQLDTDSLEKQGRIETVYCRAGVTLRVNLSKALAATSTQMQDVHRHLNQNPGSEPWEEVGIRAFNWNLSLGVSEFEIPQFGRAWMTGRGKVLVEPVQEVFKYSSSD